MEKHKAVLKFTGIVGLFSAVLIFLPVLFVQQFDDYVPEAAGVVEVVEASEAYEQTAPPVAEWMSADVRLSGLTLIYEQALYRSPFLGLTLERSRWDELYLEYTQRVLDAENLSEYYIALTSFVSHLADGKSQIAPPNDLNNGLIAMRPVGVRYVENRFIVFSFIGDVGIPLGSEILRINGTPTLDWLEETYGFFLTNHTPLQRQSSLAIYITATFLPQELALEIITPAGEHLEIDLPYYSDPMALIGGAIPQYLNLAYPQAHEQNDFQGFSVADHGNGIKQIILPSFGDMSMPQRVRNYLETVQDDISGVILDVRNNGGGASDASILSHFVDVYELNPMRYYPVSGWGLAPGGYVFWVQNIEGIAEQSLELFHVPVVVLANYNSGSAADCFVASVRDVDGVTIIGTNTAGMIGDMTAHFLPEGGIFRLSLFRGVTHDGIEVNNHGIPPDIWSEQTVDDLLNGIDTTLTFALQYMQEVLGQEN
ncbi:MAG: S41 family peptidase [Defluviitaleaceae bacterium]|nr:S41 family peptidase [Defluviitaleaceae bacterium]